MMINKKKKNKTININPEYHKFLMKLKSRLFLDYGKDVSIKSLIEKAIDLSRDGLKEAMLAS